MADARRLLPPMSALAALESAARSGSFSRAARDSDLTQSAVSRQIANLEDWLGARLFERQGRGVALTPAGRVYVEEISAALDRVRAATRSLMAADAPAALSIATLPGFGMRWLAPRLPRFLAARPRIAIDFAARHDHVDLHAERFDAAIRFGDGRWAGLIADRLFDEEMAPVCSPGVAATLRRPEDIARAVLLGQATRPMAWRQWLALNGVDADGARPHLVFEHFMMLTEAAVSGSGVALIPTFLIEQELSQGLLVRPFETGLRSPQAYYLVHRPDAPDNEAFGAFRTWLLEEAAAYAALEPRIWECFSASTI